ncbi:MAG: 6-bladed beta-propeller [Bacteroidia bacterium]|nr:6-bladed beta-propeller [Bacteroidia bacterium]
MKTIVIIFAMIFFCFCDSKRSKDSSNSDSVIRIDLLSKPKSTVTKLSEFATNVEYIPLQTTKNSLLGEFALKIVSADNKIYIRNSGLGGEIMCFDVNGKFLFKLQNLGRGPEEYTSITDFDVSSDNKILTVLSNVDRKILVYDISGTGCSFERSFSLKEPFPLTIGMVPETDYAFLAIEPWNITAPTLSLLISSNGDTILYKPNCYGSRQDKRGAYTRTALIYQCEKMLCFKEIFSDTVFYIDVKDKSFKPRITFDTHGTLVTPEMWGHPEKGGDHVTSIFRINETLRFIFYYYWENRSYFCILFDKKTETKYQLDTGVFLETIANIPGEFEKIKFKDDLSGGPDFNQDIRYLNSHFSGGKLFSLVDAIILKNYVASEDFRNARVQDPKNKNELKNLADSLNETDNPVLVVVTLKD